MSCYEQLLIIDIRISLPIRSVFLPNNGPLDRWSTIGQRSLQLAPVTLAVIGVGSRGRTHAEFALQHPERAQVLAVAEPREFWRSSFAERHNIPSASVFNDWRELAEHSKLADAVVIATQDTVHTAPAVAFAEKGYHVLLEKPMAPTAAECRQIVEAVEKAGVLFSVCHVLRYTPYTRKLKEIVDSGTIGEVVSIERLEPIGSYHFAHSYVRGNWRKESQSAPMLLAKSCHDLDWLRYVIDAPCRKVSSFGGLYCFRPEKRPANAADRCLDCRIETSCPYSAKKIYLDRVNRGDLRWPVDVLTSDLTVKGVTEALRIGPYGRCVWACDNNVADHQVVTLEFTGGQTASFTATAFTQGRDRQTRIFGTKGELRGDGSKIEVFDYLTEQTSVSETNVASDGIILTGHGKGDYGLMDAFTSALAENNPRRILSGPRESLDTHLMVFAAERARRENRVVEMTEMDI